MWHEQERRGKHIGYLSESQKERDYKDDQDVSGQKIIKWTLERRDGVLCIGSIWLRIGTSGGFL
jgi:hypothetical protein